MSRLHSLPLISQITDALEETHVEAPTFPLLRRGLPSSIRPLEQEESSVYVAATLESQPVWFMAAGRRWRSEERQLLSRQPIPSLAPLPSLPGTQHPGQATGTDRENARNPLDAFARRFAGSHPPTGM